MANDIVQEATEAFRISEEAEQDNRRAFIEDVKFARLSEQWPEAVLRQRQDEFRPCLTINRLQPVIRQVVNDSRQNRPATAVHPCDSKGDPETAEVLSGMIRNIEQSSDADVAYDTAVDCAVTGGFGYWRVKIDYAVNAVDEDGIKSAGEGAFDQDIFIRRIANPLSVYGDPYSVEADSSDWMQAHVTDTMTMAQFKRKYPGAEASSFDHDKWQNVTAPWRDGDEVMIAEYWKREKVIKKAYAVQLGGEDEQAGELVIMFEDEVKKQLPVIQAAGGQVIGQPRPVSTFKVCQYIVSGAEELEKNDWAGAYIPIIPVYGDEVNVEGKRYFRSLIRDAKDSQRNFNYWRTTMTETIALAPRVPFIGPKGAFETDGAKWATANSHSHPYIEYDGQIPPARQMPPSVPTGALQEAMNAAEDIKAITGIYDASLGARSNETSGVAINARKREGDISTFHFIDNLSRAIRHSGRVLIDIIPKVYSTERIVRIIGPDGTPSKVKVNAEQPEMMMDDESMDNEAAETLPIHDIRVGRYDVTVKAGPSFSTRREEAATQMIEMIRAYPAIAPIIGDLLAKNLDWPGADEMAKRLEKMLPPGVRDEETGEIPPEVQQQIAQMSQALEVVTQKLQQAESSKDIEREKLDIDRAKVEVEIYKAETDRAASTMQAMTPEQVQAIIIQTLHDLATPNDLPDAEDDMSGPTGMAPEPEFMQA